MALAERLGVPVPPTRSCAAGDEHRGGGRRARLPGRREAGRVARRSSPTGRSARTSSRYAARSSRSARADWRAIAAGTPVLLQRWLPGDGHRRRAADGPRPAARGLPAPPAPRGAADRRRELAAGERRPRRGPLRPCGADAAASSAGPGSRWSSSAAATMASATSWRSTAGSGARCRWRSEPGWTSRARLADLLARGRGRPPIQPVATDYRRGVRARNLRLELGWIGAVLSGRRRQRGTALARPPAPRRGDGAACSIRGSATT